MNTEKELLESIDDKLGRLIVLLENPQQVLQGAAPGQIASGAGSMGNPQSFLQPLVPVSGMDAPWVRKALGFNGKSEVYDEEELTAFLGFNPNGHDPDGKPWCAGFLKRIFEDCDIDTSGVDLSALSFQDFGYSLFQNLPSVDEIPNGAVLVFQPREDSKYNISHVGLKVDGDKLFGGNQGDAAKKSNLAFYLKNATLVAARCPNGYQLV